MNVNVKHKNSVFSFLFSNPDTLRELYYAIEGVSLPADIPIDINTLSNAIYMDQINDISFTIDNRLVVLIEHQSSVNRNMPLRLLIYIARVFEKIIDRRKLYQTKQEMIPAPEFIVLYNGKAPQPDYEVLKLSDAFKDTRALKKANALHLPALELIVPVYNINHGHNAAILEKSAVLGDYSFFIDKIRECEQELPKAEAMKAAIQYCTEHNILKPFLETHSSEVFNMLLTEWNTEEAKEVWFAEGLEEGLEKGLERGLERGREEGLERTARNALAEGFSFDVIEKITGLNQDSIRHIQAGM